MPVRNDELGWGWPARLLHWGMALLIIGLWLLGKLMVEIPDTELQRKFEFYQLHKSFGLLVFLLAVLRLGWRLANPTPSAPEGMPRWERLAARTSHALFYLLLVLLPLSGFLMAAASPLGIPTVAFGVVPVPHPIGPDADVESVLKEIHEALGNILALLLLLHVGAALKHHLIDKDTVLRRMLVGHPRS
jgi:cytochrome b561